MIIKTGNSYGQTSILPQAGGTAAPSGAEDAAAASGSADGTAVQLQRTAPGYAAAPANASKLAEIKQAISEGRFQVNAGAVAGGLIQSVVDLLSAQ